MFWDFLGGPVVRNPPSNAGDTGSVPGLGSFYRPQGSWGHGPQLLKPSHPRAHALQQKKPLQWEAHTPQPESGPHWPQLEKAHVPQWRPMPQPKVNKWKVKLSVSILWLTQSEANLTRWASRAGLLKQGLLTLCDSAQDFCQPVLQCPADMPEETVKVLQAGAEFSTLQ